MVTLNQRRGGGEVHGPQAGLALLDALDGDERMAGHHRLDAVRAHLLEMAGDRRRGPRAATATPPAARPASPSSAISRLAPPGSRN